MTVVLKVCELAQSSTMRFSSNELLSLEESGPPFFQEVRLKTLGMLRNAVGGGINVSYFLVTNERMKGAKEGTEVEEGESWKKKRLEKRAKSG